MVRDEFPGLAVEFDGRQLVYLDSASTAQKPRAVLDAVQRALTRAANIHRGVHRLSEENTLAYEGVRAKAAHVLGVRDPTEIVFTRGTTESINLVAQSWARTELRSGDQILLTELEHHSNIVPWQWVARSTGAELVVVPVEEDGSVQLAAFEARLNPNTRLVAISHVSNALGTVLEVASMVRSARAVGALTLVDGAQAVPHLHIDLNDLGCDFYTFSGHKMYGPTGAGVLWARRELLERMPPYQGGGDMIAEVRFEETTYNAVPHKFEAGTPDIVAVLGLGAALDWWTGFDQQTVHDHEERVYRCLVESLRDLRGIRMLGPAPSAVGAVSFLVDDLHPHDVGTALDAYGIAVRTGHHCAQPLMERFGVDGTVRASLGIYNDEGDVAALVSALERVRQVLA
ncbi:MAG: aminotransferase class V-fold PLP-dependent enzyme [Myxococcota bacterium]